MKTGIDADAEPFPVAGDPVALETGPKPIERGYPQLPGAYYRISLNRDNYRGLRDSCSDLRK
uniref:hypothetical protein n=1 Tax=Nocardia suismassiliense TaxID=2077092 RepID=UPI003F4927A2